MGWRLPQPYVLICDYEETKVNKNGSFDFNNFLMHPVHKLLLLIMIIDKHLYQNIAICCCFTIYQIRTQSWYIKS